MKKISFFIFSFFHSFILSFLLVSCDSGDIVDNAKTNESGGHPVKLTACVSGMENLSDKYTLSLATFQANDNYALTTYTVPPTTADNTEISIVIPSVDGDVSTIELAITNRLRQRVISLASINMEDYADSADTIRLNAGNVNVGMMNVIQQKVFNQSCIQCHGGNGGGGAAGLNLTEGQALANLADVSSTRIDGMFRVVAGAAAKSLLHMILAEGGESVLHYNHTEVLSSQFKDDVAAVRTFIDDWINSLKPSQP